MAGPVEYSVDEFVDLVRPSRRPMVLWLGSGVSFERPSGLPTTRPVLNGLVAALTSEGGVTVKRHRQLLRDARRELGAGGRLDLAVWGRIQFEAAIGEIRAHTGEFVPRMLAWLYGPAGAVEPNSSHRAVAAMAPDRVDRIITTNFDECLEAAIADPRLTVISPVAGPFHLPAFGVLKAHGTISQAHTIAADPEGLRRRAADRSWRESLAATLSGRDVLFVGYSFSDHFDINPALAEAAVAPGTRFFAAIGGRTNVDELTVQLTGFLRHDLAQPELNVLVRLAETQGFARPGMVGMPDQAAAAEGIRSQAEVLLASSGITVGGRLQALAALYFWLEEGSRALRLFEAAFASGTSTVDRHVLARAYLRARRYRAAVGQFALELEPMLGRDSPDGRSVRLREADLCIGAGHCAAAAGRRRTAATYYRRARRALSEADIERNGLDPYLADQFYRSQAEWEVAAAQRSHDRVRQARHLKAAESWLARLELVEGLPLTTQPLHTLVHARVAALSGQRLEAAALARDARSRLGPWGDPHGVTVCERIEAIALDDRRALWRVTRRAWSRAQFLEAAESLGDLASTCIPSGHLPTWVRLCDRLISGWDFAKDLLARRG